MLIAQNLDNIQKNAFNTSLPKNFGDLISSSKILDYVYSAAGIALLVYLIMGGLQMMTSKGDPKAMQMAQGKITNALIGFIIIAVAFVLVRIIGKLLGLVAFQTVFGF